MASAATASSASKAPTVAKVLDPVELRLVRALPIERRDNFQPSGLLWESGKLLTVSDKHDAAVFELVLGDDVAQVRVYRRVELAMPVDELDFEGLTSDGEGGLLLASEAQNRVLQVERGAAIRWLTPSLQTAGARAGLFRLSNAKLEGLARLGDGRVVLAAERSERGLLELPADGNAEAVHAWSMPTTPFRLPGGRLPDFSDLATSNDGGLFALVRNGHLIVRLEREGRAWREVTAWSFSKTENDERYAYVDRKYGLAEGLAIDQDYVYVALDNNGDRRLADPKDTRPQLLIFERPPQ